MKSFQRWLACCVFALSVFGQSNQGSITGSVTDQTDAVVPNAAVTVRNVNTNTVYSGGASATGNYVITVPQGTYELNVTVPGFKAFQQTGIPVIEGQASRRNVRLELGQATEVITVTDQQQLLKTESGEVSYRVTSSLVNQLPVLPLGAAGGLGNIRNPAYMMTVLPGVSYATAANTPGVFFQTMTVNGLPANSQTITLEGQDATPSLWRGVTSDRVSGAAIDAIEAVQVQTSNFAAEFGKAGGAAINYTMKSGTNQYHGSVFNYWVNEFMHAGTPYTDYADQANPATAYKSGQHIRNKQRRFDFGGTFGGPIKIPGVYNGKDKSFFFFNFEQFRQNIVTANGVATVPTDAYRIGDFTASGCNNFNLTTKTCNPGGRPVINSSVTGLEALDVLGQPVINGGIYDTNSYQIVNSQPVRTYLANQQLPLALFDEVSKKIQAQFPAPTNQNLTNNYAIPAYKQTRVNTIPSIKLNHNFNSTWRMDGYWGWQASDSNNANGFAKEQFPWTSQQLNPLRSHTIRLNLDASLTPTLLLHIGVGYYHYREPNVANKYDQSLIGLPKLGAVNAFSAADVYPTITGISGGSGGFSPGTGASFDATAWEQKPTANLNLTWIKNNHTFKFGGDTTLEGYVTHNKWRANGNFAFGSQQAGNPWTNGQALSAANPTGFAYASFLQGQPDSMSLAQTSYTRLGGHAIAFFMQDNWKVTPKLTVEYGIRYDFQTYLKEQHGRHASAAFNVFNPAVGRPGAIAYEATCGCNLSSNYGLAFGPRINVAYQITPKTVFRAGGGINYNVVQTPAGNNFSVGDFYQINSPGFGLSSLPLGLEGGNTFYPGNPYGNTPVIWPVFDPGRIPPRTSAGLPPSTPFSMYHPDSKPGRIFQWSVGVQREVIRNLVIEATYVGNRGAWFYAPLTDTMSTNSLAGGQLARFGLDIRNPADRTLLGAVVIGSPAAAARGFFLPYVGFPGTQALGQAIRPIPQWGPFGVNPYLGPYRGNTWYDALQFQATKRYSHNIDLTANVTWAHGMALGSSADTDFFFAGRPQVTDPFNRANQKQLNQLVSPLKTVISGTYITPALPWRSGFAGKIASMIVKDWQVGAVMQYQSGQLLGVPTSNNGLVGQLRITPPAGAGYNPWNYIPGTPFFREGFDPNGDFDPRAGGFYGTTGNPAASVVTVLTGGFQTLTVNGVATPNQCGAAQQAAPTCAWSDVPAGEWGSSAPYLEGFRWRRRPSEALNIGRNFRFGKDGRYIFNVRGEFQNIFNRMFYSAPATGNPTSAVVSTTVPSTEYRYAFAGYGVVSTFNGGGASPRQGTVVMRLTF